MKRMKLRKTAQQLVEKVLQFAAQKENIEEGTELSVTFVDNERIQEINKEYRNKDLQQMLFLLLWKKWAKMKWKLLVRIYQGC